jgi:hypothetical protein
MGHITTERIEDAWSHILTAEQDLQNGYPFDSLRDCKLALSDLYDAAYGMDLHKPYTEQRKPIETSVMELQAQDSVEDQDVEELIAECAQLFEYITPQVMEELHSRLDYSNMPEPDIEEELEMDIS